MRTLLIGICIAAAVATAPAQQTSGTLTVGAFDHDGAPLEGLIILAKPDGRTERRVPTGPDGLARIALEGPPLRAAARLEDVRPYFPIADLVRGNSRTIAFRVYSPEPGQYGEAERADFATNYLGIVRASGDDGPAREIATFLHPDRPESAEGMENLTVPPEQASIVSIRLVNPLGAGQQDRLVFAYGIDPATGLIRIAAAERTDKDGYAVFRDLPPGRLYRLETGARGTEVAISSFFRTEPGAERQLPPAVMLEPARTLRGIVLWEGKPVPGVAVSTTNEAEQPILGTTTDSHGAFVLGPLNPGIVSLSLHRSDLTGERPFVWRQSTGLAEAMIPMEMLAPPRLGASLGTP